ncbi:hypothetical protein DSO57_1003099 [Entomophthora muscae]|uniref:Uncharacterized protein n=1 Tax=Entomophthora muscae TaxID=34485 RepID=A0ACC2UU54_9FUNG|nr:hypothetical protein DSO57_1003099 [Entomophthora muscae]
MKDSDVVIMTELRTFKMTGTIEEYIAAYKDLCDQVPNTINFEEPGPQLDFYNGLPTYIRRQFNMTCCKNLENVFLEGKCASQKSDNLHAINKQKESPFNILLRIIYLTVVAQVGYPYLSNLKEKFLQRKEPSRWHSPPSGDNTKKVRTSPQDSLSSTISSYQPNSTTSSVLKES